MATLKRMKLDKEHDAILERLDKLYEKGFDAFLVETDFDVCEYLSDEDAEEYNILLNDLDKIEELLSKDK